MPSTCVALLSARLRARHRELLRELLSRGAKAPAFQVYYVCVDYSEPGVMGTLSERCCQTEGKLWVVILDQARKVASLCNHVMA